MILRTHPDIHEADRLMKEGKKEEAAALLRQLAAAHPTDPLILGDVMNIYLYSNLFAEARAVPAAYKGRTGKEMGVDFGPEEIDAMERKWKDFASRGGSIFRNRWFWNAPWLPLEIRLEHDALVLVYRRKIERHPWATVKAEVRITSHKGQERRVLHLKTPDRHLRIIVSDHLYTYTDGPYLPDALAKHVDVQRSEPTTANVILQVVLIFLVLFVVLAVLDALGIE